MSEGSGDGLTQELFDEAMAQAIADGFEVIRGTPSTLLLDLDTDAAWAQFERVLPTVEKTVGTLGLRQWPSKSGNRHVQLKLVGDLPALLRIALQAALGSDGVREALALKRLENGIAEPSSLFRPTRATAIEELA